MFFISPSLTSPTGEGEKIKKAVTDFPNGHILLDYKLEKGSKFCNKSILWNSTHLFVSDFTVFKV